MTLFTLNNDIKIAKRDMFIYLGISLFCMLFGFIYELNGHGIYSFNMAHGFIYPLFGGFAFYLLLFILKSPFLPSIFSSYSYNAGVATLTVGSYFKGVLDIYGTTREIYYKIYIIVGITALLIGLISYLISIILYIKNSK